MSRVSQIRKCLQGWDLLPTQSDPPPSNSPDLNQEPDVHSLSTPTNSGLRIDTHSVSDDWEVVKNNSSAHSRSRVSVSSNVPSLSISPTYTPSPVKGDFDDPEAIDEYKERPLPSIPKHKRKGSNSLDRPAKDRLKLTCHHGDEFHPVEMTLGILNRQGPSPIETYASDDQSHERIAVGLERSPDRSTELPAFCVRKAGQWSGSGGAVDGKTAETAETKK
jgi:hypothetical protein